ncbi:MAG: carboxylesterase/lipase family protein [Coriobacteriales bacterium]|jgi:para-nitrobenzyl esterase
MGSTVRTNSGKVHGKESDGVLKWLGIPFGKPPVGELRYRRAQPADPWDGTLECDHFGNAPFQFAGGGMAELNVQWCEPSEDCLYLNVWAPENTTPSDRRPVFVWIYGGANHMGESSDPQYDMSLFAKDGVVGISFNYRLGPLGFYDFSNMSDRFDSNNAVSDMLVALQWVQDNIANFGGDPDNVTICGESAGGQMVYAALICPACKGLFTRAIAMSGLAGNITDHILHDLGTSIFLEELGLDESNIDDLADMPIEKITPAAQTMFVQNDIRHPGIFFPGPTLDGDLIPDYVWKCLDNGSAKGKSVIIGTCHDEGNLFTATKSVPSTWEGIEKMFSENGYAEKIPLMKKLYGGKPEIASASEIMRDRMFWVDAVRCALAQCGKGDTYMYRFDYVPTTAAMLKLNATHSMDLSPTFGYFPDDKNSFWYGTPTTAEKRLTSYLHGSFVNFCKNGDPNGNPSTGIPVKWPKYDKYGRQTMLVDIECSVVKNPNRELFDAWEDISLYM